MALIRCAECGKEISDRAAACVYCGCPVKQQPLPASGSPGEKSPGAVRKAAAAVMAVLSVLSAFIYCESFISGRILSILMAAASVCLPLLVFFGGRFLHRRAVSILFLLLYAIATLAWAFAYNIDRLELDRGFFSYYDNTLGLFLGIFQIVSIISVLVLFFSAVLNVVKKKHAALAMGNRLELLLLGCGVYAAVFPGLRRLHGIRRRLCPKQEPAGKQITHGGVCPPCT